MRQLLSDVLPILRSLRRRSTFTILIVLCLALGIGANSTVFSIVDAVLLRPLPYADPDRLVILLDVLDGENYNTSQLTLAEWRRRNQSFTRIEAMDTRFFNVLGGEMPERVAGGGVSAGLFDLLGVKPVWGRLFSPEEDVPGGPKVVMISHGFFMRRFGGDPKGLEKPLLVDGESHTVVGVLPPSAEKFFPRRFLVQGTSLWVPIALPEAPARPKEHYIYAVGRLEPGVDLKTAQAEMKTLTETLAKEFPDTNASWGVKAMTLRQNWVGHTGENLVLLFYAVGFVLLIACANVGNLLLTRAIEQQGEMAVRMSFGAGRWQVMRQFLTESLLLGLIGGAVGLGLSILTLQMLPAWLPARLHHHLRNVELDYRLVLFTFGVSVLAGIIPGLVVAWRISSRDLFQQLGDRRSSSKVESQRLRKGLVVAEVALSLVLLVGAGLMIKSFGRLGRSEIGFDPENLLTYSVSLPESRAADPVATNRLFQDASEKIRALPGVTSVGVTSVLPISKYAVTSSYVVEGRAPEKEGEVLMAHYRRVDAGLFESLGLKMLHGRSFQPSDDPTSEPVTIVSEKLAERFWPGGQAVGQRIRRGSASNPWLTIVGVAPEIQEADVGVGLGSRGTLYTPYTQGARPIMFMTVKTTTDPLALVPSVRGAILAADRDQPIDEVETMAQRIDKSLSESRFTTFMLAVFSALSLILALSGLYGLLSYSVALRHREIGMRMAMGASARDIVGMVLRQTMTLALVGLLIGAGAAFYLSRLIKSMLYQVEPSDPATYVGTFVALALTCFLGAAWPAWRASRSDPATALRED